MTPSLQHAARGGRFVTFRVQLYHPHEVRISQQTWPRGLGEEPGEPFLHGNVTEMMSPVCTPFQCRMEARSRLQRGAAVGWALPPRAPCGEWEGRLPSYRVARAAGPLPAPGAPEAAKAKGGERSARGTTPGRGGGSERPRCLGAGGWPSGDAKPGGCQVGAGRGTRGR